MEKKINIGGGYDWKVNGWLHLIMHHSKGN